MSRATSPSAGKRNTITCSKKKKEKKEKNCPHTKMEPWRPFPPLRSILSMQFCFCLKHFFFGTVDSQKGRNCCLSDRNDGVLLSRGACVCVYTCSQQPLHECIQETGPSKAQEANDLFWFAVQINQNFPLHISLKARGQILGTFTNPIQNN